MKNKKGFTLVEILVVIGLISIILVITIPSIIAVRRSIKTRELETKKELLISAAEVYAQNNQSLFPKEGGIIEIPVRTLVYYGYVDSEEIENNCSETIGCVMNPTNDTSMNNEIITIKRIKSVTQAMWGEVDAHKVTFYANGAIVGKSTDFISIGCDNFSSSCTISVPTIERDGYEKLGFNTKSDGTGTTLNVSVMDFSTNSYANEYYAQTRKNIEITFDAGTNGGTLASGVSSTKKNCLKKNTSTSCTILGNDPEVSDRGAGYIKKSGWYDASTGGNEITTRTFSESKTLYAQWDICQKGEYALVGATSCTPCSVGAYSASVASSSCTVCGKGKTTTTTGAQALSDCTDCQNKAHVAEWETPSWSSNNVTNLCKIKSCESGYKLVSNACEPDHTFAFNYTGNFRVNDETTVRTGDYSFDTQNWEVYLLTTGTFTPYIETSIDIFAVGGGGGGAGVSCTTVWFASAGGGGGGFTNTVTNKSLIINNGYAVTIGNGGPGGTGEAAGTKGETTLFGNLCSAEGGNGGNPRTYDSTLKAVGGIGGSGGSGGGTGKSQGGAYENGDAYGGSNGSNGGIGGCQTCCSSCANPNSKPPGGEGCATNGKCKKDGNICTNTTAFCSGSGIAYSGGGGAGVAARSNTCGSSGGSGGITGGGDGASTCYSGGNNATPNTGGGGGGAADCKHKGTSGFNSNYNTADWTGGSGGSGLIIIRNKR